MLATQSIFDIINFKSEIFGSNIISRFELEIHTIRTFISFSSEISKVNYFL